MTNHEHERAIELIMRAGAEEIPARDSQWLESHLARCTECAQYAADFDQTGRLLQSVAITAGSSLVKETQAKVRAHAVYLQEQRSRMVLIAISFCIGAMSSTLSAWLWWRFGGWVAGRLGLPAGIVQPGVFVAWLVPASIIAVVMLISSHQAIDRSVTLAWLGEQREGELQ